MKAPESLKTLIEYGIIQDVVRPLMSGKEAQVFIVVAGGEECVAKVYKEAKNRTFKHRAEYTEGRRTRNTRDQRAINKRTQHGRKKDEDAWRSTEVDMIYRLRDAGVRVPEPMNFVEGVLVMELVKDAAGEAAPRLGDLSFSPAEAKAIYDQLIREVVRMLCAGVIHGDLSDFNVLLGSDGPVVIDFPQAIDPTHNPNGEKLLLRDVENLHRFLSRFAPDEIIRPYGQEIWKLFQTNKLKPDTELSGVYEGPSGKVDTAELMGLIEDANRDEARRRSGPRLDDEDEDAFEAARDALGTAPATFRKVVDFSKERRPRPPAAAKQGGARRGDQARSDSRRRPRGDRGGPVSDEPSRGGRRSRTGKADAREIEKKSGARKAPPPGPRALMDKGAGQAPKGEESGTAGSPGRRRNRRRRGSPKAASERGATPGVSPARPAASGTPRPKTGASESRGSATDASPGPARRRRRRRPRKKPDAE